MYKLLQHLKFFLTATNQHGVHSPFIYKYVTQCLYAKSNFQYSKSITILLKSITYLKVKQVRLPENSKVQESVQEHFPHIQLTEEHSEILFLYASEASKLDTYFSQDIYIQNDALLILDGIHANKTNNKIWNNIKMHEKVTVTIDMFHCGAVFFREEQVKEHFKIRI